MISRALFVGFFVVLLSCSSSPSITKGQACFRARSALCDHLASDCGRSAYCDKTKSCGAEGSSACMDKDLDSCAADVKALSCGDATAAEISNALPTSCVSCLR